MGLPQPLAHLTTQVQLWLPWAWGHNSPLHRSQVDPVDTLSLQLLFPKITLQLLALHTAHHLHQHAPPLLFMIIQVTLVTTSPIWSQIIIYALDLITLEIFWFSMNAMTKSSWLKTLWQHTTLTFPEDVNLLFIGLYYQIMPNFHTGLGMLTNVAPMSWITSMIDLVCIKMEANSGSVLGMPHNILVFLTTTPQDSAAGQCVHFRATPLRPLSPHYVCLSSMLKFICQIAKCLCTATTLLQLNQLLDMSLHSISWWSLWSSDVAHGWWFNYTVCWHEWRYLTWSNCWLCPLLQLKQTHSLLPSG